MNQRGEVLTLFLIAFAVFTALMAVGIAVDQMTNTPSGPQTIETGLPPVETPN